MKFHTVGATMRKFTQTLLWQTFRENNDFAIEQSVVKLNNNLLSLKKYFVKSSL